MRRTIALLLCFALLTGTGAGAFALAGGPEGADRLARELIEFNDGINAMIERYAPPVSRDGGACSTARLIVGCEGKPSFAGSVAHASGLGRHVIQYRTPEEATLAAERLRDEPGVAYAVPDAVVSIGAGEPMRTDPMQEPGVDSFHSWGFGADQVNAAGYNAWLLGSSGGLEALPEIIVAVIDTGLETGLPYFQGRVVPGYDFAEGDADVTGGYFHGTHVAGTIVDGTLPNVKVMPVKCSDNYGNAFTSHIINSIQYAYLHGADVANVSMGEYYSETLEAYASVIDSGCDAGMVCCVASGNDGTNVAYCCPACIERAFTVAAHDRGFAMWSGSNCGDAVDVTAPGVEISSMMPNGSFSAQTGTSMASPHAAAACAMLKSRDPQMSADDVMAALKWAAVDRGLSGGGAGTLSMTALIGGAAPASGDVDGDGNVTANDALLILRHSMGLIQLSAGALTAADADGSGSVTANDALIILRRTLGLVRG
ncbi:MAG: S8 family serine peptidase [Clostridia bacterium]|nr:S8 family serine peptidase [Clostridia bacterium]